MNQGRRLINILKREPMTYLEMLMLGISVCPWKRIKEQLRDDEKLVKKTNHAGLIVWSVK